MQRLSDFIRSHEEELLVEWERFARSLAGGATATVEALRDHAREMLHAIADDLDKPQTANQQVAKSLGEADASVLATTATAAQEHGAGRAERGFTFGQMIAEFRALRASVLRHWAEHRKQTGPEELEDITRFNEAIDQAIAESVERYTRHVENARTRLIGILGHDLVTPIGAITTAAKFLQGLPDLSEQQRTLVGSIESSAIRMHRMTSDLLDFARTGLGEAIPITTRNMDLRDAVETSIAEVAASNGDTLIELDSVGDSTGTWDYDRLVQAAGNLIGNAVQHGKSGEPVIVTIHGEPNQVVLSVNNRGPLIPQDSIPRLFEPGERGQAGEGGQHLGLGLYIVDQVARAHDGTVTATSTAEDGTTFTLRLPR